jgi:hypothetical protein
MKKAVYAVLFWGLAAGLVYCQAPLYYSNQNQYFLHGLADAGYGSLEHDWLANTADPTPVFSLLVSSTYRFLHPLAFHLYYVVLLAVYFYSLTGIVSFLAGERATRALRLVFVAAILAVHSAAARWASYRLFGLDYPWYFQAGVAGQYALGAVLQPSMFGVLLLLSVLLFLRDRPYLAAVAISLGATVHSTYLLGGAMLTLGFMFVLGREGRPLRALLVGALAFALVLPVIGYVLSTFSPQSSRTFAEANQILTQVRIPHHCQPRLWCDGIALGQIAWVLLAVWLVRGTRLFGVMLCAFLVALVLTVLQVVTENDTLALMFPWRISAVMVPVATAVILGRGILAARGWLDNRRAQVVSATLIGVLMACGAAIMVLHQGFQDSPEEAALMDHVKNHLGEEDLYLIPAQLPDLRASTRGSLSSDFKPVADKEVDPRLIPVNLQRFRLSTGAPIFVDFKSIPYLDTDVLKWYRRLEKNQEFYTRIDSGNLAELRDELRSLGVTNVVTKTEQPGMTPVYRDEEGAYLVYPLTEAESPRRSTLP